MATESSVPTVTWLPPPVICSASTDSMVTLLLPPWTVIALHAPLNMKVPSPRRMRTLGSFAQSHAPSLVPVKVLSALASAGRNVIAQTTSSFFISFPLRDLVLVGLALERWLVAAPDLLPCGQHSSEKLHDSSPVRTAV